MVTEENKEDDEDPSLTEALKDLGQAESHLEHAQADEAAARREIGEAIKRIEDAGHDHAEVHVEYINDMEKVSFRESIEATLRQVWDQAYLNLHIEKKPKDIFQTGGKKPKSLMSDLNLTLKEARDRGVIENYKFGIVSEHGGA